MGDNTYFRAANLIKGRVVSSNFVTTVSPSHAGEARYGDGGFGRVDPEIDPFIPARYSVWDIDRKYEKKEALRDRFWLRKSWSLILGYVGRLDEQKGMHLVHHALFHTLAHGGQFVLLGHAHHHDGVNGHSWQLKHYLNDSPDCHLEIGYQEELAHQVHAGADLVVVPSMFEPWGLATMTRCGTGRWRWCARSAE